MDKEYLKRAAFYAVTALLSIAATVYFIYHLLIAFDNSIIFEQAILAVSSSSVVSDGYIFRDESVLFTENDGVLESYFDEGEHVKANTEVARVHSSSAIVDRQEISKIDRQIRLLQSSNLTSTSLYDTKYIDRQISEMYYLICDKLSQGDFEYACKKTDELNILLNQRQIITNTRVSFNNEIAALEAKKESLTGSFEDNGVSVRTKSAGYYYSSTDGYENVFTPDILPSITPDGFAELCKSEPAVYSGRYPAGKLVDTHTWYIVCTVDKIKASEMHEGQVYNVSFLYAGNEIIPFTLDRIASSPNGQTALLILKTDIVPDGFVFNRSQKIEIVYSTTSGVRVPANALRVINGEYGVYILDENVVRFIKIDIIFEGDGYYISQTEYPEEDTERRLKEHDRIITAGKELYDGKIAD